MIDSQTLQVNPGECFTYEVALHVTLQDINEEEVANFDDKISIMVYDVVYENDMNN